MKNVREQAEHLVLPAPPITPDSAGTWFHTRPYHRVYRLHGLAGLTRASLESSRVSGRLIMAPLRGPHMSNEFFKKENNILIGLGVSHMPLPLKPLCGKNPVGKRPRHREKVQCMPSIYPSRLAVQGGGTYSLCW